MVIPLEEFCIKLVCFFVVTGRLELALKVCSNNTISLKAHLHARKRASDKCTLDLKPRADVTKSQIKGISGPTKNIHVLQNITYHYRVEFCQFQILLQILSLFKR